MAADLDRRERDEAIDKAIRLLNKDAFGMVTVTKSADGYDVVQDHEFINGFVNDYVEAEQFEGVEPDFGNTTFSDHSPEELEVCDAMNVTGWRELTPVHNFLVGYRDEVSLWAEPATVWWTDGEQYKVSDEVAGDIWVMCAD